VTISCKEDESSVSVEKQVLSRTPKQLEVLNEGAVWGSLLN
jgi:hypothetical protein